MRARLVRPIILETAEQRQNIRYLIFSQYFLREFGTIVSNTTTEEVINSTVYLRRISQFRPFEELEPEREETKLIRRLMDQRDDHPLDQKSSSELGAISRELHPLLQNRLSRLCPHRYLCITFVGYYKWTFDLNVL